MAFPRLPDVDPSDTAVTLAGELNVLAALLTQQRRA